MKEPVQMGQDEDGGSSNLQATEMNTTLHKGREE